MQGPPALGDGWGGFCQWGIALSPHGDTALTVSEAPKEAPARKFVPASVYLEEKTDEQKKEEVGSGMGTLQQGRVGGDAPHPTALPGLSPQLLSAMVARLGNRDDPLPQDSFEGVDEDEWVSAGGGHTTPRGSHPTPRAPHSRPPAGLGWIPWSTRDPTLAGPGGGTGRRKRTRRERWRRRRARRGQDPLLKPLHQHRVLP